MVLCLCYAVVTEVAKQEGPKETDPVEVTPKPKEEGSEKETLETTFAPQDAPKPETVETTFAPEEVTTEITATKVTKIVKGVFHFQWYKTVGDIFACVHS